MNCDSSTAKGAGEPTFIGIARVDHIFFLPVPECLVPTNRFPNFRPHNEQTARKVVVLVHFSVVEQNLTTRAARAGPVPVTSAIKVKQASPDHIPWGVMIA
ncbi:MAG TPA: hypothetical protein VF283_17295 [Bryobacteraceae bacterium]